MNLKLKETVILSITKYITELLVALSVILILFFRDKLWELHVIVSTQVSGKILLPILEILFLIAFIAFLPRIIYLRKKLKKKYLFDLIWKVKPHPECTKCKISLNYSIGVVDESFPGLKCPKCGKKYYLRLNDNKYLSLQEAQGLL